MKGIAYDECPALAWAPDHQHERGILDCITHGVGHRTL